MSPFCLLQVPLHPPHSRGLGQPPSPHLCARRCRLWGGGERVLLQLPASCPDSWLPPEAGQCREMFAPKQLHCVRNCLTLPRKEISCHSTLRPPQSGDRRPELAGWPRRGVGRAEGVSGSPDGGGSGAQGHLSLGTGAFLPAYNRKRVLSRLWDGQEPDCQYLSGEPQPWIHLAEDNEKSTLM